ncbi:MAG: hypothetical protein IKR18_11085 [Bacteroidaceae bacterium]|nr:hypothetical protein [Bacteroidaceae bacterium]
MNTGIVELIRKRLESIGTTWLQYAEHISASPAQVGAFLRGEGSLSVDCLNKSFELVGVDLSLYSKRDDLARDVAKFLILKGVSSIDNWTKKEIVTFTHQEAVSLFFDVDTEDEFEKLKKSGIIDIESTFPYFKAMVTYYMSLGGDLENAKPTPSRANRAYNSLERPGEKILNHSGGVSFGAVAASALVSSSALFKGAFPLYVGTLGALAAYFIKKIDNDKLGLEDL